MGSSFSRQGLFGSLDGFLGEYEKNFERLSALKDRHAALLEARNRSVAEAGRYLFAFGALGTGLGLAYVLWVHRQPDPGYSTGEKARASRLLFLWFLGLLVVYYVLSVAGQWAVERAAAKLRRATQEEQKLLTRLKEQTNYDKVQTLIRQREEQFARAGTPGRLVGGQGGLHTPLASLPGPPGAGEPGGGLRQQQDAAPGGDTPRTRGRTLSTLQRGLTGAGQHLIPAIDRFANTLVGDNPALVEALRAAQSENGVLRTQLGLAHEHLRAQAAELAELRGRLGLTPTSVLALPEAPGGSHLRRGSLGASGPLVQEILPSASSLSLGVNGSGGVSTVGGRVSPGGSGAGAGAGAAPRRGSTSLGSSGRLPSFAERLEQSVGEQERRSRPSMEGLGMSGSGEGLGPASHPVAEASPSRARLPARQRRRSSEQGGGMRRSMSGPTSGWQRPGSSAGAQDGDGSDEAIEQPE